MSATDKMLLGWVVLHMNGPKWSMWDGEVHRDLESAIEVFREVQNRTPSCFIAEVRVSDGDFSEALNAAFTALAAEATR